jgi:hypothetical protein
MLRAEIVKCNFFVGYFIMLSVVQGTQCRMVQWLMNKEWKGIWKEMVVAWSRYYPRICLKGLRKLRKASVRIVLCPSRDSIRAPSEYTSRALQLGQSLRQELAQNHVQWLAPISGCWTFGLCYRRVSRTLPNELSQMSHGVSICAAATDDQDTHFVLSTGNFVMPYFERI